MKEKIELAKKGRQLWISLVENYQIDCSTYVILLPGTKREYNAPAVIYLNRFLEKKYAKRAILLTYDEWVLEQAADIPNTEMVYFSREDAMALIQFYSLYEFAANFVIASLEEPVGRLGCGMINKGNITSEQIFAAAIYGLFEI